MTIRCTGHSLLNAFLTRNSVTLQAAADALGTSKTSVLFWIRGEQRPREPYRVAIETWTHGDVPASSWETATDRRIATRAVPLAGRVEPRRRTPRSAP